MQELRERLLRRKRLDPERSHVFELKTYADALRSEIEYDQNGHTGLTLVKADDLRVVLEVARAGSGLKEHVVEGPAAVQIVSGCLEFRTEAETFRAEAGEIVVLPQGAPRTVRAQEDSAFLLTLSLPPDGNR